jgi:hypothetical protein
MSTSRRHFFGYVLAAPVVASLATVVCWNAHGQVPQATEYQAKANWLLAFAQYTNWRDDDFSGANSPFIYGILGIDPFGKDIEKLTSHPIRGHRVEVRSFKSVEDVTDCHILFISSSEKRRLKPILDALKGKRILTVSEVEEFTQQGGIASVVVKQTGVVVSTIIPDLNKEAADRGRWDFKPQLLATIRSVQDRNK